MVYSFSWSAFSVFAFFVGSVLGLSFYLGSKAKSAAGYYAAHGGVPWFINGIAFAGDYLSAASFLGICGMIAFYGYDGFLYSIGYLAGWVVALFVIAEPLKRLGRFTFADALDSRFNSRGIKLSAAISTLVVSVFYLIPQMVGAGAPVKPLLGFSHSTGEVTAWRQMNAGGSESAGWESQTVSTRGSQKFINGLPQSREAHWDLAPVGHVSKLPDGKTHTGPLGPLEFLSTLQQSEVIL